MADSEICSIIALPPDIRVEFLAEGGANIVYRIHASSDFPERWHQPDHKLPNSLTTPPFTANDVKFRTQLLRLRKAQPSTLPYITQHALYTRLIAPLFPPSLLLPQELTLVPSTLTYTLNHALHEAESHSTRRSSRHGLYLCPDPHGLLISDMSASPTQLLLELKPKWLLQSPSAPPGASRCRTCALRAMRASGSAFCPLDLDERSHATLARAVHALMDRHAAVRALPAQQQERVRAALLQFLTTSAALPRLRELQSTLDPLGVLALPDMGVDAQVPEELQIAMTVRDCTLFLRLEEGEAGIVVEGRLGDLDVKGGVGKVQYWKGVERELVRGGWYVGARVGCRLERGDAEEAV